MKKDPHFEQCFSTHVPDESPPLEEYICKGISLWCESKSWLHPAHLSTAGRIIVGATNVGGGGR